MALMETMKVTILISIILAFVFLFSSLSFTNATDWCSNTPYPKACKEHMIYNPQSYSDFQKLTIQVALMDANRSESRAVLLESESQDAKEKAALQDCVFLYGHIVYELSKTLDQYNTSSASDKQTWLSTALTNIDTCENGFINLNVTNHFLTSIETEASMLISNALVVNSADEEDEKEAHPGGFPSWVSAGNRKLLMSESTATKANLVVAQDGSGNYRTVQAALNAATNMKRGSGKFVIYVKKGVYNENVRIETSLSNIMLVGDDLRYTIITGSRSVAKGFTCLSSATVGVTGDEFMARGITFRNTAGPQNGAAAAFESESDKSVFYLCGFEGYQDTLYVHAQRQFYRECYIYGTVDFIFGNAAVVFQDCTIYARRPMTGQANVVTAQGRTKPYQNTGISIHGCKIMAGSDLVQVQSSVKTYLGRPWKEYSRVVYLKSYIGSLIDPAGWLAWDGNSAPNTIYYGEFDNSGPGSSTANRVKWKCHHVITSKSEASKFTVGEFIDGDSWLPATGVPYTSGL